MPSDTPLVMSDEEFLNAPIPDEEDKNVLKEEDEVNENTEKPVENIENLDPEHKTENPTEETDTGKEKESEKPESTIRSPLAREPEEEKRNPEFEPEEKTAKTIKEPKEAKEKTKETENENQEINYEVEFKRLTAPFRANGKEMQINNVDDAIHLMQQGANYTKKMAAIKPNLKLMKMLENNNLLDEKKLSYLIDLDQKNPEAIKKLVKESEIDTYDLSTETDTEYTPNTYTVDDAEMALDGVLDEIRGTQSFDTTIDIISNKWDASSRRIILETPEIIKIINEQMESGIYSQINSVVEKERMLGRLEGLSDLEAYKTVGDAIQAKGGFNHMNNSQANESADIPADIKPKDDPKLKNRKRAASSTRSTPGATTKQQDFNPLSLSDDEFNKVSSGDFI